MWWSIMAYTGYDPRVAIREAIGTTYYDFKGKEDRYAIEVTDDYGEDVSIPMLLSEEINPESFPEQPYMEILPPTSTFKPGNPGATIRNKRCFFYLKLYFTATDRQDAYSFKRKIINEVHDATRNNQSTTVGTWFFSIASEKPEISNDGNKIVMVHTIMIEAVFTDVC